MVDRNHLVSSGEAETARFLRVQMAVIFYVHPRLCLQWAQALRKVLFLFALSLSI